VFNYCRTTNISYEIRRYDDDDDDDDLFVYSSGAKIISVQQKHKDHFRASAILLLYIIQKYDLDKSYMAEEHNDKEWRGSVHWSN
jgi:hypothetical protein